MNPNINKDSKKLIFESHFEHCDYIFSNIINTLGGVLKNIIIIGEKRAGFTIIKLMEKYCKFFLNEAKIFDEKIQNIFLIDSKHGKYANILNKEMQMVLQQVII